MNRTSLTSGTLCVYTNELVGREKAVHRSFEPRKYTNAGEELLTCFATKVPVDSLTGIVGIGMPLIAVLIVEKELEDARQRRENSASNEDKSKNPCHVRPKV